MIPNFSMKNILTNDALIPGTDEFYIRVILPKVQEIGIEGTKRWLEENYPIPDNGVSPSDEMWVNR